MKVDAAETGRLESLLTRVGAALDQFLRSLELCGLILHQKANEHIGIDADHQRDNRSTGTAFLPFFRRLPARLMTLLFLRRISTVPSGISVNMIRSPDFIPRLSRMPFGIVV